jgi:hypothetical protein
LAENLLAVLGHHHDKYIKIMMIEDGKRRENQGEQGKGRTDRDLTEVGSDYRIFVGPFRRYFQDIQLKIVGSE